MLGTPCACRGRDGRRAVRIPHVRVRPHGPSVSTERVGARPVVGSIELEASARPENGVGDVVTHASHRATGHVVVGVRADTPGGTRRAIGSRGIQGGRS